MKKTVHIVIENGCVIDAFADRDIDVIVYNFDTLDPEMRAEVEASMAALRATKQELEIL